MEGLAARAGKGIKRFKVEHGKKFKLSDIDPGDTAGLNSRQHARTLLEEGVKHLSEAQDKLYAESRWSLLLIFQAMDAAGKDGAIKHVMSGINPQGCEVYSFKAPSATELSHDYMWRTMCKAPQRGRICIFNRSYYEEVLAVRVHPELLASQNLPAKLVTKHLWKERYEDIRNYEQYLTRNGVVILKFFLHVSHDEQKLRFLARLDDKTKNWKFSTGDLKERGYWNDYMDAYQQMIRHTAAPDAPWFVVPADNKWFTRVVVAAAVIDAVEQLNLVYPKVDGAKREELKAAKEALLRD